MAQYSTLARLQLLSMAAVVLAFVASAAVSIFTTLAIDSDVEQIVGNAMPSVQYLSAARGDLHHLDAGLRTYVGARQSGADATNEAVGTARHALNASLANYLAQPFFPNELAVYREVQDTTAEVDRHLDDALSAVDARDWGRAQASLVDEQRQSERADGAMERVISLNAAEGQQIGLRVVARRSWMWSALIVEVLVAMVGVLAAVATRRSMTNLATASGDAERRASWLQERSSELDQFAGRVAHDILSPLMVVGLGLQISRKRLLDDAAVATSLERAERSLLRVRGIVAGLLEFARAGAQPQADARADLREGVDDLILELRDEAEAARVQIVVEAIGDRAVACSPGVLSSLLGNLVRNAIKYMGDSTDRRVIIRCIDAGQRVRVE
ncbi:MAG TPA: HAMP domain-containing sensor histidine kinase, partial [Polyangiaceae bacterium]|nr:HAMP domain-containing sensor histidine kinase [Polyangiaceae bacterium]